MPAQALESRVKSLENRVTSLAQLPARIDDLTSQVSHLRTEMRAEFSAVRSDMAEHGATMMATLRHEMAEQGGSSTGDGGAGRRIAAGDFYRNRGPRAPDACSPRGCHQPHLAGAARGVEHTTAAAQKEVACGGTRERLERPLCKLPQ
jgi:hypothetical protein